MSSVILEYKEINSTYGWKLILNIEGYCFILNKWGNSDKYVKRKR